MCSMYFINVDRLHCVLNRFHITYLRSVCSRVHYGSRLINDDDFPFEYVASVHLSIIQTMYFVVVKYLEFISLFIDFAGNETGELLCMYAHSKYVFNVPLL